MSSSTTATLGGVVIYTASTVFTFGLFLVSLVKFNDIALALNSPQLVPSALVAAMLVVSTYFAGKAAFRLATVLLTGIKISLLIK